MSTPWAATSGLPACSAGVATRTPAMNSVLIAARMAAPWRRSPTSWPKLRHRAAGITKIATICSRLVSGVGFS